jgi:hypothetical protein
MFPYAKVRREVPVMFPGNIAMVKFAVKQRFSSVS